MRTRVTAQELPQSPCTGVCRLDAQDVCAGCARTIDEIIEWPGASDERKRAIVAAARRRLPTGQASGSAGGGIG
ncbi:MAG: DUF1289 domain-containing protein [Nevskiaceae bacterium]